MKIMKKWIGALMAVALCATTTLLFTACGGGGGDSDSDDYYDYYDDDNGGSDSNSDAYSLYGTWFGVSGSSIITKLVFAPGGKGYIKMNSTSAVYSHNGQFTYTFDSSRGYIDIVFSDTRTSVTYKINSLSKYESMKLINDYDMTYNMIYDSYSTEIPTEYADNVVTNVERVSGKYINMPKSNSRYTSEYYFHYYKKTTDSGHIELYKDEACQNLIGTASTNTYDSWGGYLVGSYDYIIKTSTDTYWTYYFFN